MILTCPNCAARYTVKDATFPPEGRKVRCTKCGHSWFASNPAASAPEPVPTAIPADVPASEESVAAPASAATGDIAAAVFTAPPELTPSAFKPPPEKDTGTGSGRRLAIAGGWALLVLSVLVLVWSAYRYREEVVASWPRAASLYAWVGWPAKDSGIILSNVHYSRVVRNSHAVLVLSGSLRNPSAQSQYVPQVRVFLRGADGRVLQRYVFAPPVRILRGGETENFHTDLNAPPAAARHLTLELAEATDGS